jgi:hypothetical protein
MIETMISKKKEALLFISGAMRRGSELFYLSKNEHDRIVIDIDGELN